MSRKKGKNQPMETVLSSNPGSQILTPELLEQIKQQLRAEIKDELKEKITGELKDEDGEVSQMIEEVNEITETAKTIKDAKDNIEEELDEIPPAPKRRGRKKLTPEEIELAKAPISEPEMDGDEKDIVDKVAMQEKRDGGETSDIVDEVVGESESKDFSKLGWWVTIPKRDRMQSKDIVYHADLDRFGIFVQPSRKEGLCRVRLFKLGSKTEVYSRDWFLEFDALTLVKHGTQVKRGFAETDVEFLRRAGKTSKAKEDVAAVQ